MLTRLLFLTFILQINIAQATLQPQPLPPWVKPIIASSTEIKTNANTYNTYINLYDHQINFLDKKITRYTHLTNQVLNSNGLQELGKIEIEFDPLYQNLVIHHVKIIRDEQQINVFEEGDFEIIRNENQLNQGIYSGTNTALMIIKDLQVNDMIDYAYSVEGQNPIYDDHLFDVFFTEWSVPLGEMYLRLTTDRDLNLQFKYHKQKIKPQIKRNKNTMVYLWHKKNIKAIDYEGQYPNWFQPRAYFELSEFADWNDVAQWAHQVFNIDQSLNEDIQQHISRWLKIARTDKEKIAYALKFVQENIRYMGIELGINSHQPRLPIVTYESKFGDCKDKTMLLKALLKAMNIKSTPALVSTYLDKGLIDRLPSPILFDHVILHIATEQQDLWLDPTMTNQGSRLSTLVPPDFGYALLVSNDTQGLKKMDRLPTQVNIKSVTEKFSSNQDTNLHNLNVSTQYIGKYAESWRYSIQSANFNQITKDFESFYINYYEGITSVDLISFDDDIEKNILTSQEYYEVDHLWTQSGRYEALETFASLINNAVTLPTRVNRQSPLYLSHPIELNHQFIFEQAQQFLNEDIEPIEISTDNIYYKRSTEIIDNKLHIRHHFTTLSDHVPIDQQAQHIDNLRKIRKALSFALVKKLAVEEKIKSSENRLKNALRSMLKENTND